MAAKQDGRFKEVWFAGVHSDVGGTFTDDHGLADIAMEWVVRGGIDSGLVNEKKFQKYQNQPLDHAYGKVHDMGRMWALTEIGCHRKIVPDGATVHESVTLRGEHDRS